MSIEVRLFGGDNFEAFTLPCAVKTPACAGGSKSGTVTLMPNYTQLDCCRACFDAKIAAGEWALAAKPVHKRPAYEADPEPTGSDAVKAAFEKLVAFKKRIAGGIASNARVKTAVRLSAEPTGITVRWFGWHEPELLTEFLELLVSESVASHIEAIEIAGEPDGVNGTRNWELTALAEGADLPRLVRLTVEGTKPNDHGHTVLGDYTLAEAGLVAKILDRTPALDVLEIPSAPDETFFRRENHPLKRLVVQTGYDHQGFIDNLARSTCFAKLETLDFTDFTQSDADDFDAQRTPRSSYDLLFATAGLPALRTAFLRGTKLAESDADALRTTAVGKGLTELAISERARVE
jgi:hypothetical protein